MSKTINLTQEKSNLRLLDNIDYQVIIGIETPQIGERLNCLKVEPTLSFNEARASTVEWSTSPIQNVVYLTSQIAVVTTKNSKILVTKVF